MGWRGRCCLPGRNFSAGHVPATSRWEPAPGEAAVRGAAWLGARWRGRGLRAGAGGAAEGEPRASLVPGPWDGDTALSSPPAPRGAGFEQGRVATGAGAGRDTLRVPGPVSATSGRDLPAAGRWWPGRAAGPGRAAWWHRPCRGHLAAGQRCPSARGPQSGTRHCQQAACCLLDSEIWPQLARIQFNYDKQRLHPLSRD